MHHQEDSFVASITKACTKQLTPVAKSNNGSEPEICADDGMYGWGRRHFRTPRCMSFDFTKTARLRSCYSFSTGETVSALPRPVNKLHAAYFRLGLLAEGDPLNDIEERPTRYLDWRQVTDAKTRWQHAQRGRRCRRAGLCTCCGMPIHHC